MEVVDAPFAGENPIALRFVYGGGGPIPAADGVASPAETYRDDENDPDPTAGSGAYTEGGGMATLVVLLDVNADDEDGARDADCKRGSGGAMPCCGADAARGLNGGDCPGLDRLRDEDDVAAYELDPMRRSGGGRGGGADMRFRGSMLPNRSYARARRDIDDEASASTRAGLACFHQETACFHFLRNASGCKHTPAPIR
mmetsp:Transcript_55251/g.165565  ORF Transcript_55251/g.165565 Transcript_55251/m.165565 type:complete len:199 (+) Transcript_55251:1371-1967(+)